MDYDYEISHLKESLALVIRTQRTWEKIQAATAKTARDAREATDELRKSQAELRRDMDESFRRHELRFERIDLTLAEITDKLNGLIGYVDSQHPKQ